MIENGKKTFVAGAAVSAKRLVQLFGREVIHNTEDAADDPIGITEYACASGDAVAIRLLNDSGSFEATTAGAFSEGDDVYAAADGKVQGLPAVAGDYRKIGKALEDATADGDIVEILPYNYNATETVA